MIAAPVIVVILGACGGGPRTSKPAASAPTVPAALTAISERLATLGYTQTAMHRGADAFFGVVRPTSLQMTAFSQDDDERAPG